MRAVLQRVSSASVEVEGQVVGQIGTGLLALIGVTHTDTEADAQLIARKIADLRILRGETSLTENPDAGVLVISQFTLYGQTRKGRRPTWSEAAPGEVAEPLVGAVIEDLRGRGLTTRTGVFGADMAVSLVNDGPVTLVLES
ncbi:D-aminoacyl-tRNA deacylase [Pseudactinotalea sp. Z1732]|uniref:D-aminoacyl-tRNA deacylase n=1 Tax=Pseudactinotalea sp. Z1732 TaxID=3413026 RepID=UPI003C7B3DDD